MLRFDHSLARELEGFALPWQAARPPAPSLLLWNAPLAEMLGMPDAEDAQLARWFSGAEDLPGSQPLAMAYAGHQFGHFNPQLGDGRALLLGEVIAPDGRRFDLQFKGSGPTPFSRQGDGKCALGPALREYLVAEAMAALGVPTTRSLAVVLTGEGVWREASHPGAVLTRVAASHIRIGTFEWAATHKGHAGVAQLADYALQRHFPEQMEAANRPLALLEAVCSAQAALVARWMNLGFVHGVMNTDNVTISGETIDYGPCAFLDAYGAGQVFSSIDRAGRYAFGNQPAVCHWNLYRLASALIDAIETEEGGGDAARALLADWPARYEAQWIAGMRAKLGLTRPEPEDLALVRALFAAMEGQQVDFTRLFRALGASLIDGHGVIAAESTDPLALQPWWNEWQARLAREPMDPMRRRAEMDRVNPAYVPRNHLTDAALAAAEGGDLAPFEELLGAVTRPFTQREGLERYAHGAPAGTPPHVTYCGT